MKLNNKCFFSIFLAFVFLTMSTAFISGEGYGKSKNGETWGYGITPGIFIPADGDFDNNLNFSIGGLVSFRKCDVRMLELEGTYSSLDVDSSKLLAGSTDTDATHWTLGINAIFKLGKKNPTIEKGWHAGFGLHYNNYDLPSSFITGSDDATGIGGKFIIGHRWNKNWQARITYLLCGEGNNKAVGGGKFKRSGMEIQLSYLY
ncbi:hypothetical protein ACFL35_05710 [Candidatus Riflebacteria bacterium]